MSCRTSGGGTPQPHAHRSPSLVTAASAKPQVASCLRLGFNMDPSMYQTASAGKSSAGSSPPCHVSNLLGGKAGSLRVSSPVVASMSRLPLLIVRSASLAASGVADQPVSGTLHLQVRRWLVVPAASRHNWHRLSVMFHFCTAAFLVCGHCPPTAADSSEDACFLQNSGAPVSLATFPAARGASTLLKSMIRSLTPLRLVPTSGVLGMSPG